MTSSGSVSTLRAASVTPVRIRFRRQVYSGKNNINRAPSSERREETKVDVPRSNLSLVRFFFRRWTDSISLSLSRTILFFFFFLFSHLLLSKFERLSPFSFFRIYNNNIPSVGMGNLGKKRNERNHSASLLSGEWKICCPPIRNRINVPKQPVKVSIPPL